LFNTFPNEYSVRDLKLNGTDPPDATQILLVIFWAFTLPLKGKVNTSKVRKNIINTLIHNLQQAITVMINAKG